jgi:peroxiredoxin
MLEIPTFPAPILAQEAGPALRQVAPDFSLRNHANYNEQLADLVGERGILLAFIGNVWNAANVRRIIWLQRHAHHLMQPGITLALISRDQPHTLYGYSISSATPLEFPLLSDIDGSVHRQFNMENSPGMVLLDHNRIVSRKWLMPDDRVWPRIQELQEILELN